jgi:uncharacterized OsmC-like protein
LTANSRLQYSVRARRVDAEGSLASCKSAEIALDTNLEGRNDAFNPAELLLAAVAACIINGIERVTPMLDFEFTEVDVLIQGTRQDNPPRMTSINYEIVVSTNDADQRLELLHKNIRKYGTISNTIAIAVPLEGSFRRKSVVNPA